MPQIQTPCCLLWAGVYPRKMMPMARLKWISIPNHLKFLEEIQVIFDIWPVSSPSKVGKSGFPDFQFLSWHLVLPQESDVQLILRLGNGGQFNWVTGWCLILPPNSKKCLSKWLHLTHIFKVKVKHVSNFHLRRSKKNTWGLKLMVLKFSAHFPGHVWLTPCPSNWNENLCLKWYCDVVH